MQNNVGGITPLIEASYTVAASASAFTALDVMGNSNTGSAVVPITFSVPCNSGEIIGARCSMGPASSTPVTADLTFDLMLFRPVTSIPYAAAGFPANNGPLAFASLAAALAVGKELLGVVPFAAASWQAYDTKVAFQRVGLTNLIPFNTRALSPSAHSLVGLMLAKAAWDNGNVAHTFQFALDIRGNHDE